nr:immunoglobulin heavy chain junction region [Macaca mulatta]
CTRDRDCSGGVCHVPVLDHYGLDCW